MKFILVVLVLVGSTFPCVYPQSPPAAISERGRSMVETAALASLVRAQGAVFVGGHVIEEHDDRIYSRALMWKISDSTVTEIDARPAYEVSELFWLDEQTGWIYAAGAGVYKTVDGGKEWVKEPFQSYGNVVFLNRYVGWYFGYDNHLMQVDGEKIHRLSSFDPSSRKQRLQFVNSKVGWLSDVVADRSRLQRSEDGGKTWSVLNVPFDGIRESTFFDGNRGYVAASEGLYSTLDGGRSWKSILPVTRSGWINRISFISPEVGWTIGARICATRNSGQTWNCRKKDPRLGLDITKGFVFTSEADGWILVGNKLFFTTDGGKTWKRKVLSYSTGHF